MCRQVRRALKLTENDTPNQEELTRMRQVRPTLVLRACIAASWLLHGLVQVPLLIRLTLAGIKLLLLLLLCAPSEH